MMVIDRAEFELKVEVEVERRRISLTEVDAMEIEELKRSIWEGEGYCYLSKSDSDKLDEVKDSDDPKDKEIVRLILGKAGLSREMHRNSMR